MIPRSTAPVSRNTAAFSTLELMVATAVLLMLIIVVAEMVSNTLSLTNQGRDQVEADSAARTVFDRMALDFDKIVNRKDVDYIFKNRTTDEAMSGNDAMFFYSEAPGYASGTINLSSVAVVGYRVVTSASNTINGVQVPVLERLGKRLSVDGASTSTDAGGMVFLARSNGTVNAKSTLAGRWTGIGTPDSVYTDGTDACYHVLSPQVVRMETAYLLKSGTKADGTVVSGSLSQYFYNPDLGHTDISGTNYRGLDDVAAIVVSLAILDNSSRKVISNKSIYTSLIGALDDYDPGTGLMAQVWKAKVESSTFAKEVGLPKAAASQVRFYQRFFYLK